MVKWKEEEKKVRNILGKKITKIIKCNLKIFEKNKFLF